jgi:hypothetical protein
MKKQYLEVVNHYLELQNFGRRVSLTASNLGPYK